MPPPAVPSGKISAKKLGELLRTSPLADSPKIKSALFGGTTTGSPSRPAGPDQLKAASSPRRTTLGPFNLFNPSSPPSEPKKRRVILNGPSAATSIDPRLINILATYGFRKRALRISRDLNGQEVVRTELNSRLCGSITLAFWLCSERNCWLPSLMCYQRSQVDLLR